MTDTAAPPSPDTRQSVRRAGLRWWSGDDAIVRRRRGRGFSYEGPDGRPVRDQEVLARICALAIPPAWTDVRICPDPHGHLQAVGRDARGRRQYRYNAEFRAARDAAKFHRLVDFGAALPRIRERVESDLARPGFPREKVLALVVRLLELTLVRVGSDEYARLNRSFGLTTLRDRHVRVDGSSIRFRFRGKSGKAHEIGLRDRRLARLVERSRDLPGRELFQYVDEHGDVRDVHSDDVNAYLREVAGPHATAKMFRTWAATVLACRALTAAATAGEPVLTTEPHVMASGAAARKALGATMRAVAERLGNTPTVARQSYVHPAVLDAYLDGSLGEALVRSATDLARLPSVPTADEEQLTVAFLRRQIANEEGSARVRGRRRPGSSKRTRG